MRPQKFLSFLGAPVIGLLALSQPASAYVLNFEGNICGGGGACFNYSWIDQNYGDVAGLVDVITTRNVGSYGYSGAANHSLLWWANNYSGLTSVAWGDSGVEVGLFLKPAAGYRITLNGFDGGSYLNATRSTQFSILDGTSGAVLFSTGPTTVGALPVSFSGPYTSSGGIKIQWGPDGFDVGVDNVNFSVTPIASGVPEPATWAMMLLGFAGLGMMGRRRKVAQA